jgi:hypothetical protein
MSESSGSMDLCLTNPSCDNKVPHELEKCGSIAETTINSVNLLGIMHIVDQICDLLTPHGSRISMFIHQQS